MQGKPKSSKNPHSAEASRGRPHSVLSKAERTSRGRPHFTKVSRGRQEYDPQVVEKKWQEVWEKEKIFSPDLDRVNRRPYYNLMMFPYPSAEGLHVGNMYAFTGADIWGRFVRMQGHGVFEPIGLDGFGIHSENYAIKIGEHPRELAKRTEKRFYEQLRATGNAYDWRHTLETYDIDYYRWTQWIFVQMFKHGLAYRQKAEVNWCPSCRTVLADEQVISGECERCMTKVERRELEQWFFRITDYADRLLDGLEKINWTPKVKTAQRNWIGRSEGAVIRFAINKKTKEQKNISKLATNAVKTRFSGSQFLSSLVPQFIEVFTTRPDTLHGATFLVVSPESNLAEKLTTPEQQKEVSEYINQYTKRSIDFDTPVHQSGERDKSGVFTGSYAVNPVTGHDIQIWVADYVLGGYGSGAVMGVPAHDQRDFEFAKKYDLPIVSVINPDIRYQISDKSGDKNLKSDIGQSDNAYIGSGVIINSANWNGWKTPEDMGKVIDWLEEKGIGKRQVQYHLRDWLISRQRYWGPPIPMIYCEACAEAKKGEREDMPGWYAVPEDQLPVELPYIENYQPKGSGVSPLAQDKDWMKVKCPGCGDNARRETDVSDTFLDSAWYFFRYTSTDVSDKPWDEARVKNWLPVHMYIGGAEHSVLHLMYSRFVTMAFKDWGLIDFDEPYERFYAHGLLIKDGAKMSKSKGNVVVPDEYIKKYGADTLRTYLMFLGPFDQGGDFRDTGIEGMNRFIRRVWDLVTNSRDYVVSSKEEAQEVLRAMHKTVKRVTQDMEGLRYNRAIAGIMEDVNFLRETVKGEGERAKGEVKCAEWEEALQTLLKLLAPFAPHMTEELWQSINTKTKEQKNKRTVPRSLGSSVSWSVHFQAWPVFNPELAKEEMLKIPVQVNGRLRGIVLVNESEAGSQEVVEAKAREIEAVNKHLDGKSAKKVIFVPARLINFVV